MAASPRGYGPDEQRRAVTPLRISVSVLTGDVMTAEGLSAWLQLNRPHVICVHASDDARRVAQAAADLVILDIDHCPSSGSVEGIVADLAQSGQVLLLGSASSDHRVRQGLLAGASGHVHKDRGCAQLAATIEMIACGRYELDRELVSLSYARTSPTLSPQEIAALRLYAQGHPLKTVARNMGISAHTAKEYLDRVRAKYANVGRRAHTKSDLARVAREDGLLD